MTNKVYIVTGATGFLGSVLVKKLVAAGHTVHAVVRSKDKAEKVFGDLNVKIFVANICDKEALKDIFNESGDNYVVIHTAGSVVLSGSSYDYAEMRRANIYGTQNIVDLCTKRHKKLIYVSSVHALNELKDKTAIASEQEVFDPKLVKGHYAKSKAGASSIVVDGIKFHELDAVIVHPSAIIGPDDTSNSHTTLMIKDYLAGRVPAATKGGFNFVDVRDVADGIIAAENASTGSSYILSGKYYSVKEMLDILHEVSGRKKITKELPIWLAKCALPFVWTYCKLRKRRPLYTGYHLYAVGANSNYNNQKAIDELSFNPRELKETLTDTVAKLAPLIQPKLSKKEKQALKEQKEKATEAEATNSNWSQVSDKEA